ASRSRASALLSPCSGLTASWARTFSTGILSRSIAACDPTSGARVADCRATEDMNCSLERACGNLKKEFPKLTRCGLLIDIKDQPTPPESMCSARDSCRLMDDVRRVPPGDHGVDPASRQLDRVGINP